jgi:prevent-host-death family protein
MSMRSTAQLPKEKTASLRDAKAKLSSLTKQAKAGTRVVITNHGTPIADLVQHGTGAIPIRQLKHPGPLPKLIQLQGKGPTASELVLMDRAG